MERACYSVYGEGERGYSVYGEGREWVIVFMGSGESVLQCLWGGGEGL